MNAQENHLDALDTYSSSITSPFEQTLAAAAAKSANITNDPGWAVGIPLLLFLLSVVPAIPALVTWIIGRIFRPSVLVVFGTEIPVHVVWFWYLTCFIVFGSLLALGIAWKSHQSKLIERRFPNDELLTVQQFRFALCSAVIREIEAYRTNKRTVHLEKAFDYWNQFILQVDDLFQEGTHYRYGSRIPYVLGSLYPVEGTVEEKTNALTTNAKRSRFLLSYITKLIAKSSWFEVSPATEAIVKAFDDFIPKITFRLVDRRDLGQLSECLRSLREYLYTRIPDLTDSEATRKQLDEQANASISLFASQLNGMPPYQSERTKPQETKGTAELKRGAKSIAVRLFANQVPLVRFVAWWITVQIGVGTAIAVCLETVKTVKLDSTLVALLLGSPLAIAAALTPVQIRKTNEVE